MYVCMYVFDVYALYVYMQEYMYACMNVLCMCAYLAEFMNVYLTVNKAYFRHLIEFFFFFA